jgi:hypothetical protein
LDLLLALSLRVRELLLARLQLLRQEDLFSDPSASHLTTEERIDDLAEELAEDAATAMWTFACAKACTGMRSIPLFEACSSILCQNPVEMRERAQAADYEPGVPLGTNDVIDRLARSEIEDESVTEEERKVKDENFVEEGNTEKDALLDWLSPTEINDVLWAIALHGSVNGTSTLDEAPLSETVVALREIAFDRMIDWLEHDLIISSPLEFESNRVTEISTQSIMNGESAVTVEVVDAATLLASEMQSSEVKAQTIPVENITLEADVGVKVVDAAALLASIGDENAEPIESEVIQTPVLLDHDTKVQNEDHGPTERMGSNDQNLVIAPNDRRLDPIFSLHDLATMAWSVTELRDSLKVKIVGIVIELIERMGQHDLACLTGGDLANLAWAVSKYEDQLSEIEPNRPNSLSISVTSWIARTSLQKVLKSLQSGDSSPRSLNVLESFQPPELGRLVWSVASTMSTYSEVPRQVKLNSEIMELARLSLEAAASNLSLFATEDLVRFISPLLPFRHYMISNDIHFSQLRISWAFLELCGDESHMMTLSAADALGSILATVEQSLHRWERGECNRAMPSPNQNNDASVFSSFFGKSRLNQQLLEHMLIDGEDEDDSVLAPLLEESRKPLLKDLSLDPSTLCKAACSLQRLSRAYPNMKGGWTITRVAVRLLSSKNAQLMKECSIHDISRLCEATVLSEADGHGRELITGLFARKVIQVLNDSLDSTAEKQDGCIEVSAASSRELCLLLWSLGELGAKHYRNDDARHLAYKKMRLVSEAPLLSKDQIESLDFSSSLKLVSIQLFRVSILYHREANMNLILFTIHFQFRGLVLMNFMSSDKSFLLLVLQKVEMETKNMRSSIDLCSLAESIAVLKEALKPGTTGDESGNIVKKVSISENAVHEQIELTGDESSGQVKENEESLTLEENMPPLDDATIDEEMRQLCDIILTFIGSQARDMAGKLSSVEIRRFLVVYSLLPFQDDELVNDFAQEIENRLLHLQRSPNSSFESLLINARSKTLSVNTTLFGDSSSGSRFDLIKNGIKNLFSSSDDVDTLEKKEENLITEELESLIQESASTTSMAAKSIENLHIASGISLDSIFQDLKRGTAFELGRCNELIENYRRIEFSTGKFRSRYDKERRQDIAKRVLSRLLP